MQCGHCWEAWESLTANEQTLNQLERTLSFRDAMHKFPAPPAMTWSRNNHTFHKNTKIRVCTFEF
jgi:hypothetical protein